MKEPDMKCLIVEDDSSALKLMQRYLDEYADCDTAMDGQEAINVFKRAIEEKKPYDLVCLDIMLPELDGHAVLQAMRRIETEHDLSGLGSAKVIMTTALRDLTDVTNAFKEGCEVYLVKPIERQKLVKELEGLDLIPVRIR
jgi:two-component system, chemotaxis family, chemotaxis protein CheY